MGGAMSSLFGGGAPKAAEMPQVPDYEAERKKAEEEALKKRQGEQARGMASTILGGSVAENTGNKKKLLGE